MPGRDSDDGPRGESGRGDPAAAAAATAARGVPVGPRFYVLARGDLLRQFVTNGAFFTGGHRAAATMLLSDSRYASVARKAVWRRDMDAALLRSMRAVVVQTLWTFAGMAGPCTVDTGGERAGEGMKGMEAGMEGREAAVARPTGDVRKYVVRIETLDEVTDGVTHIHPGCLLWTGTSEGSDGLADVWIEVMKATPPKFSAIKTAAPKYGKLLPVHNLRLLLGEEHMRRLWNKAPFFRTGTLFLLGRKRSLPLQLRLLQMQQYMAGYTAAGEGQ